MPLVRCHFDSELEMNWSMTTCATLAKSPNCASQTTSWRGSARLMPNSKPSTPYSDSMLSRIMNRACPWRMWSSGTYRVPLSTSCSTAWRWLNVPRLVSCPLMRTGIPSSRSEPIASASAQPQSMRVPCSTIWTRSAIRRAARGCGVKPGGRRGNAAATSRRTAAAEAEAQPGGLHGGLGVMAVHVEDGGLDDLGDVARIACETIRPGGGREGDLVVDDDVDGTAHVVAGQLREPEDLGDDALPVEGGVAMQQDRDHARALTVAVAVLLGSHHALDHRVDGLQVTRVGAEREVDLVARARGVVARVAEVVLDVAVSGRLAREQRALEFRQDHLVRLADHVGEDVQAAAVRHAEDHLLDAERPSLLDQRVEHRDQRLAAFEREALGGRVAHLQELLEHLGLEKVLEHADAILGRELGAVLGRLHALLEPLALLLVRDVEVLDAERPAIGPPAAFDQLPEWRATETLEPAAFDHPLHVVRGETELGGVEQRMAHGARLERVQVSDQMAELAEGMDQVRGVGYADRRRAGRLDQGGGHLAVVARQLETGEESRPALVDGGGIGLVAAILLGHVVLVRQRHPVEAVHDAFLLASRRPSRHRCARSLPLPAPAHLSSALERRHPCRTCFPSRARRPS